MPIPDAATVYEGKMDPGDLVEWQADMADKILEQGEQITSFELVLDSAAIALGVSIVIDGDRDPSTINSAQSVVYWLAVDSGFQTDPAYDSGIKAAVTVKVVTNNVPSRKRERTWVTEIINQ